MDEFRSGMIGIVAGIIILVITMVIAYRFTKSNRPSVYFRNTFVMLSGELVVCGGLAIVFL